CEPGLDHCNVTTDVHTPSAPTSPSNFILPPYSSYSACNTAGSDSLPRRSTAVRATTSGKGIVTEVWVGPMTWVVHRPPRRDFSTQLSGGSPPPDSQRRRNCVLSGERSALTRGVDGGVARIHGERGTTAGWLHGPPCD